MNSKYIEQMYIALKRISKYQTAEQLRRNAEKQYGLDSAEASKLPEEK